MKEELIKLHYDVVSGDYLKAGESSSNIKKALMQLGIKSDIIKRVCVACYEAEINVVIHSYGGCIDVTIYEEEIEIVVSDEGPGIEDIDLAMTEGYSTAPETARDMGFGAGMGLPNIKKNCDVFEIKSSVGKGTEIKMIIYFE
ncbi:serine/threonine-protein kinase RsbT [Clostridium tepidiprofundi DSM 19306]|uniref:Serine/threonine-protein kinase RsbT n=1 Tax=Clostridium tepidiprofundi DSM 19306 TaxID=1121338 RepID=A0A151B344_9CLOT|nr:ATP-binding protein [Clostridium tepidiprofundi]KYH34331.1 serine/threonine-protein kinase RsbT [Clostridium tepidiprofundi DSM 19306]